jgi:hypothetical protein
VGAVEGWLGSWGKKKLQVTLRFCQPITARRLKEKAERVAALGAECGGAGLKEMHWNKPDRPPDEPGDAVVLLSTEERAAIEK